MPPFQLRFLRSDFQALQPYYQKQHDIVPASHFSIVRPTKHYHHKVVIGRLLSLCTPDNNSYYGRTITSASSTRGDPKRQKTQAHPSAILMVFGDHFNLPNCFCIFVERKLDFQRLFGTGNKADLLRIGDVVAIKDPIYCTEMLGESIQILKSPKILAILGSDEWPEMPVTTSTGANWQVFFYERGKTIDLNGAIMVTSGARTQCNGFTCDRQTLCRGCFGKATTKKPIVLECTIDVHDTPDYPEPTFPQYTSLRFTAIFFESIEDLSAKHTSVLLSMYSTIEDSIEQMVQFINSNGGWTVSGWHRQGLRNDENGNEMYTSNTAGHLILVYPTQPSQLQTAAFKRLRIKTPIDDTVPALVPAHMLPPLPPRAQRAAQRRNPAQPAGQPNGLNALPTPSTRNRTRQQTQQQTDAALDTQQDTGAAVQDPLAVDAHLLDTRQSLYERLPLLDEPGLTENGENAPVDAAGASPANHPLRVDGHIQETGQGLADMPPPLDETGLTRHFATGPFEHVGNGEDSLDSLRTEDGLLNPFDLQPLNLNPNQNGLDAMD